MQRPDTVLSAPSATTPTAAASESDLPHPPPPPEEGRGLRVALLVVLAVVAVVGLSLLVAYFATARHWFALHTGILNGGPDHYYNFWSGFGSDLGEATLITAVVVGVYTGVRKANCHTRGCWRIGRHHLDGTPYVLCRHHHPDVPNKGASHEHIVHEYLRLRDRGSAH